MSNDGWLFVEHDETGGTARIPDNEGVREWHEARGWRVVDPPDESAPFVPAGPQLQPGEIRAEFVERVHPETQARHEFPNNPEALQGAGDAGWVEPNKDGSIPKRAKASAAATSGASASATTTDRPDTAATDKKE